MPRTLVCPSRKRVVISIIAFIFSLMILAGAAPAQTRNRITQRIADTEPVVVSGRIRWARAEFDQGRVEGSLQISHAAIVFKLAPAQQADLEKLLAEQQDPHSANYHRWLTPEQYAARFGMSDADLAKVTSWLKVAGPDRGRFLPRPHPRLLQRDRGPGGKRLPHRTPPLPGKRAVAVWPMLPRFRCRRRFPAWCWASAVWTTFRPLPRARVAQAELHLAPVGKSFRVARRLRHDLQLQAPL